MDRRWLLGPTEVIQQNSRVLLAVTYVLLVILGVACVAIWQSNINSFHNVLGEYGVKIDAWQGRDTNGEIGTWWPGYTVVENAAKSVSLPFGLFIGLILGLLPTTLMYNYLCHAIARIKDLEKQIPPEEAS